MNVVFLCQRIPYPPDRGDRITTYHVLRHLLARGASVRVGCLAEGAADASQPDAARSALGPRVTELCAPRIDRRVRKLTALRGLLTGEPLSLPFFRHRALRDTVGRWVADDPPDLVYVYSSAMAWYALPWPGPRRIMQFAELDSDKWRQYAAHARGLGRWIYGREARLLLEFERRVAREFDVSFVVSEVEKELFRRCIPDVEPVVLPNGVDVDHFASRGDGDRDPHTLVFTGVMDYEPNVDGMRWFAAECWPAVRRAFPAAKLLIVGSRPCPEIRRLDGRDGITVTGRVPETPPYFDRAAVALAPLRLARGVQNKVLEAMSMGLPVVATPQAAQGLGDVPADTLRVAADAAGITRATLALLADPVAARAEGLRAARWVRDHYRWEHMLARLDAVLDG